MKKEIEAPHMRRSVIVRNLKGISSNPIARKVIDIEKLNIKHQNCKLIINGCFYIMTYYYGCSVKS